MYLNKQYLVKQKQTALLSLRRPDLVLVLCQHDFDLEKKLFDKFK